MREICLSYESGYLFKACAIRYFRYKNNKYLIYTLNEKDDRDYIKLYVVKVMKELGAYVTQTVRRQDEWQTMKGLIKRILGEIKKDKLKIIKDLNLDEIDKIVIYENRHFLLASDLVKILSSISTKEETVAPQPVPEAIPISVENIPPDSVQIDTAVSYPQIVVDNNIDNSIPEQNADTAPVSIETIAPVSEMVNIETEVTQNEVPLETEQVTELFNNAIEVKEITPEQVQMTSSSPLEIFGVDNSVEQAIMVEMPNVEEIVLDRNETTIPETEILELHNALDINPDETEILELDDAEIMELDFDSEEVLDLEEDEEVEVLEA